MNDSAGFGGDPFGVVFVLGKGGSGKSVVAEGLAALAARRGHRTLLVRIGESALTPEGRVQAPAPTRHGFSRVDLESRLAMDEYVQHTIRLRPLVERITNSEVYRKFFAAAPGLPEFVLLGRIREYAREVDARGENRFQSVVVDCPSSGHALLMLETPFAALRAAPVGPFARMASQIIEWLKTSVQIALVAIPEEMAVVEAVEFKQDLAERTELTPSFAILNRMRLESLSKQAHQALGETEPEPGSFDHFLRESAARVLRRTRLEGFHRKRLTRGLGLSPLLIRELPNCRPLTVAAALSEQLS